MGAIEGTAWRVAEKLRAWKRRRYWTTARQIEHLRTMLEADNRWMSHDTTANALTQRYLDALAPDWYRRVHEDTPDLRRRLGLVPSYGHTTAGRCSSNREEADAELARLRKIETAAKLACGLLWMTAEWRQGKVDAAYQELLEAVGGSGSQGLRESIEAAFAAGFEVDAPPGCYWPAEDDADDQCDAPPIGWRCTRSKGHSGPCAAVACPEDVDLVERGMQRLRETTNAKASGFETESS